jgi:hypothetical protein
LKRARWKGGRRAGVKRRRCSQGSQCSSGAEKAGVKGGGCDQGSQLCGEVQRGGTKRKRDNEDSGNAHGGEKARW